MIRCEIYQEVQHTLRVSGSSDVVSLTTAIVGCLTNYEKCDVTFMGATPCWTTVLAIADAQREMKKRKRKAVLEIFRSNFRLSRKDGNKCSDYENQFLEVVGERDENGNPLYAFLKERKGDTVIVNMKDQEDIELPEDKVIPLGHGIVIKLRLLRDFNKNKD